MRNTPVDAEREDALRKLQESQLKREADENARNEQERRRQEEDAKLRAAEDARRVAEEARTRVAEPEVKPTAEAPAAKPGPAAAKPAAGATTDKKDARPATRPAPPRPGERRPRAPETEAPHHKAREKHGSHQMRDDGGDAEGRALFRRRTALVRRRPRAPRRRAQETAPHRRARTRKYRAARVLANRLRRKCAMSRSATRSSSPNSPQKMAVKGADVVKALFKMGVMATINQVIDHDTAVLVVEELGHNAVRAEETDRRNDAVRGSKCRATRKRVRRSSRSWATSITARPRCSITSAARKWRRAKRAASRSTSARIT